MTSAGVVALVGAGEFLASMEPVDRQLLDYLGTAPRVVVLPTASAPDGPGVPERWANMGVDHFSRLGATVDPVMLLTRADAESATLAAQIAAANVVYLSGGKPAYLLETLRQSACWRAIAGVFAAGGVVAGCSAGAMVLGGQVADFPRFWRTLPGLGLAPDFLVIPHFDELPARMMRPAIDRITRPRFIAGIDGGTALIGAGGGWHVAGQKTVTIQARDGSARTYRAGDDVALLGD
jgi:cyanophycinase